MWDTVSSDQALYKQTKANHQTKALSDVADGSGTVSRKDKHIFRLCFTFLGQIAVLSKFKGIQLNWPTTK